MSQFFLKSFLIDVNGEILVHLRDLLSPTHIDPSIFGRYYKMVKVVETALSKSKHGDQMLIKFKKIFQAVIQICQAFETWNWDSFISTARREPDVITKEHVKLAKLLVVQ